MAIYLLAVGRQQLWSNAAYSCGRPGRPSSFGTAGRWHHFLLYWPHCLLGLACVGSLSWVSLGTRLWECTREETSPWLPSSLLLGHLSQPCPGSWESQQYLDGTSSLGDLRQVVISQPNPPHNVGVSLKRVTVYVTWISLEGRQIINTQIDVYRAVCIGGLYLLLFLAFSAGECSECSLGPCWFRVGESNG